MLSTFDLTLCGSLVSFGGFAFLLGGRRLRTARQDKSGSVDLVSGSNHANGAERSFVLAGAGWLTVGLLTLFAAFANGGDQGYLFGPWSDILFHLLFVSSCWAMTAVRINRSAERPCRETDHASVARLAGTQH